MWIHNDIGREFHIVEVRAMLEGIQLAWDKRYRKVEMEGDNSLLIESILVGSVVDRKMMELRLVHGMLIRPWVVRIRHIPRTKNAIVDCLTKIVSHDLMWLTVLEDPPQVVRGLLLVDAGG